jgi:mannose-1-phosphate guanylyltransferase
MLRTTYERIAPLLKNPEDLFISVHEKFQNIAKKEVTEIVNQNIIVETDTRNTGPAMCLEVCYLEKFCNPKKVIASLPSDDYISDSQAFRELLIMTEEYILENPNYIITPAINPNYPDTGYTYFKAGENLQKKGEEAIFKVADVVEKPNIDYCEELLKSGVYYAHTGMYLWQLGQISDLFKKLQPEMYEICTKVIAAMNDNDFKKAKELYSQIEKMTIETAITDKVEKIAMSVSNRTGWSDLGKWHVIKKILSKDNENLIKGKVITNNASNNLIYSNINKKVVVVNDLDDLIVVDTENALFVSSHKNSAEVRNIVEKLKEKGMDEYL